MIGFGNSERNVGYKRVLMEGSWWFKRAEIRGKGATNRKKGNSRRIRQLTRENLTPVGLSEAFFSPSHG